VSESKRLRLAIPNGNLQQATIDLFGRAGYGLNVSSRSYRPTINDDESECLLVRPQEQPRYVSAGLLDAGFTSRDLIEEAGIAVREVLEIESQTTGFFTRWVLCVAQDSPVRRVEDLAGARIATELPNLTRAFFARANVNAQIEYSYGATEVKVPELADAIVESTITGNSIRANGLRIVATILESRPRLITNDAAWADP
jgi:ATP phosphoribosyltransferase